jgi:hypothetical protein
MAKLYDQNNVYQTACNIGLDCRVTAIFHLRRAKGTLRTTADPAAVVDDLWGVRHACAEVIDHMDGALEGTGSRRKLRTGRST